MCQIKIKTILAFRGERTFECLRGPSGTFLPSSLGQEVYAVATASGVHEGAKIELTAAVVSAGAPDRTPEILLVRSFNGMPLMPAEASACLITKSLRWLVFSFFCFTRVLAICLAGAGRS